MVKKRIHLNSAVVFGIHLLSSSRLWHYLFLQGLEGAFGALVTSWESSFDTSRGVISFISFVSSNKEYVETTVCYVLNEGGTTIKTLAPVCSLVNHIFVRQTLLFD